MPPKKAANAPSKKTEAKKKEKTIEDKTFGLKNKKGGKQQKFIQQVEKQVKSGGDPRLRRLEQERAEEKKRKEDLRKKEEEEKRLLAKSVINQKIDAGVDPKSIFCAFFKQGLCKKGDKCKFSHDPACERKAAKRNIYADEKENDNMDDWDEDQLAEVISKKHGSEKSNKTDIICKYFLEAVENSKYGWFWSCPAPDKVNGECKYKHALPPGFVLKKDKKREEKKEDGTSLEELIEQKRAELSAKTDLTKVTLESFVAWKKRKLKEAKDKATKDAKKKADEFKAGNKIGMSGREMFMFDPKMVADEDDEEGGEAFDFSKMEREKEEGEDDVKVHEIKFDEYGIMDDGLDDTTADQLAKLKGASGPIDEDLFDDEDLDELEEDMNDMNV